MMKYRRLLAVCLVTFVLYGFAQKQEKDERTALIIDPVSEPESSLNQSALEPQGDWLTFIGSDQWDRSYEAVLDGSGNLYVLTNHYESEDGVIGDGILNDISITKIAPDGSVEWDVAVEADLNAWAERIILDGDDNIYITGTSMASWGSPLVPYLTGELQALFIAKFNANDGSLEWNTFLGSEPTFSLSGMALDADRNLYVLWSQENDDRTKAYFLAKLGPNGDIQWSINFIPFDPESSEGGLYLDLKIDANGNLLVLTTNSSSWGDPIREASGGDDVSLAKFDGNGDLLWNTFLGGTGIDIAARVAVDPNGFLYVSGHSHATWGDPLSPFQQERAGFLARLDPEGNLVWNTFIGSPEGNDILYGLNLDRDGNIFVAGGSSSPWGTPVDAFAGGFDAFIGLFDANGSLLWNTFIGGRGDETMMSINIVDADTLRATGISFGNSFGNPINGPQGGGSDVFVANINVVRDAVPAFRDPGPLVPALTTYIPTPLDISTDPSVIGTNILLAIILMLPFGVAVGSFSETISEHEESLLRWIPPLAWIRNMQNRSGQTVEPASGQRQTLYDLLSLIGAAIFYGIVFSLLDETWRPFTAQGLVLLGSMTFSSGIIGFLGDILQWRALRKWGVPAEYKPGVSSVFVSLISVVFSRSANLLPGLIFGSPDVVQVDETQLNEQQKRSLVRIGSTTYLVLAAMGWLPTIITNLIQRLSLPDSILELIGSLEAFLLVLFAVAIEGLFLELLAISDGIGSRLKNSNRLVWAVSLVACTFVFLHTLLNPRYGLVEALQHSSTTLFIGVTIGFIVLTFILHRVTGNKERQ